MTQAQTVSSARQAGRQTFGTLLRAEVARLLGAGGARPWFIVATAFALVMSLATVLLSMIPEVQELARFDIAGLASSGPMMMLIVLALGVTTTTAREISDGTVLTSKSLVPRSGLLFLARLGAWALTTVVLGAAICAASLVLALIPSGVTGSSWIDVLAAVATSLGLSVLVLALFHSGTALLQRGAVIVFVGMLLLVVLPVALGVAGSLVEGAAGDAAMAASRALPGSLLITALQPPSSAPEISWMSWLVAVLGLAAWASAASWLAYRQFVKPGYGDH